MEKAHRWSISQRLEKKQECELCSRERHAALIVEEVGRNCSPGLDGVAKWVRVVFGAAHGDVML